MNDLYIPDRHVERAASILAEVVIVVVQAEIHLLPEQQYYNDHAVTQLAFTGDQQLNAGWGLQNH